MVTLIGHPGGDDGETAEDYLLPASLAAARALPITSRCEARATGQHADEASRLLGRSGRRHPEVTCDVEAPAPKEAGLDGTPDLAALQAILKHHSVRIHNLESQSDQFTYDPDVLPVSRSKSAPLSPSEASATPASVPNPSSWLVDGMRCERATYDNSWSASKLKQQRVFDQEILKTIYNRPYRKLSRRAAMIGGWIVGIFSMPFGPIGMLGCGLLGALLGGAFGALADIRRRRLKLQESELQKIRLKSLVRWASEHFREEGDIHKIIEMIVLEFKPVADVAEGSTSARKLLTVLDGWISQKRVLRQLHAYMDEMLQNWRELQRGDFMRSMMVFLTLTKTYHFASRGLSEQEMLFLCRMERLLEHASVKSIMEHARQHPNEGDVKVMECIVFADTHAARGRARSGSPMSSESCRGETVDASDDDSSEEEVVASYTYASPRPNAGNHRALKKPFFRNWDDFMDFDITFKHKMPITLSEFELLLQKEKESTKGWDVCVDRKDIVVAKTQSGIGVVTLRAWATVPGVDLHVAFFLFFDISQRVKWDKIFCVMDLIETEVQGSDILYSLMRVPTVTPRDFLQYRRVHIQEDGSILIMLRSAEHVRAPEDRRYIRAESYISGYVLRQSYDGPTPVLNIFLMSCSDVKGMIPKWIINYFAPKKPGEWIENLRKAAVEYQAQNPSCKEKLEEVVARYSMENPYDFEPEGTEAVEEEVSATRPATMPATKPATMPATKPATTPTTKPATKPIMTIDL